MKTRVSGAWLLRCCLCIAAAATRLGSQGSEEQALRRLEVDNGSADRLLALENAARPEDRGALRVERITAYRNLAGEQKRYILQWVPDKSSLHYLIATYYLCDFWERGELNQDAVGCFDFCRKHRLVDTPDAKVGDPPEALGPLVRQRYADLALRTGILNRAEGGNTSGDIAYRGKGDIGLKTYPLVPPFTTEEAMNVALRLSVGEDPRQAAGSLKTVLEQDPLLRPVTVDLSSPGMVVFGVADAGQQLTGVSPQLQQASQELARHYFDSAASRPTLWVYANLAGAGAPSVVSRPAAPPAPISATPAVTAPAGITAPGPNGVPPIPDPATFPRLPVPPQTQAGPPPNAQSAPARAQMPNVQQTPTGPPAASRKVYPMDQSGPPESISGEEEIGRALSQTLHFRRLENLEGYYEPLDHSLVLRRGIIDANARVFLGTGLHELTHALMQPDFPSAPIWLNEGMAALHEEMRDWMPLNNYRLFMVRSAIELKRMPALTAILDPSSEAWKPMYLPVAAAASRYFCFYLFRRSASGNTLQQVYREMRDQAGNEPVPALAARVLQKVTGIPLAQIETEYLAFIRSQDLNEIQAKWGRLAQPTREFVSGLLPLLGAPPVR